LAFSVREALRQAAAAFGPAGVSVDLASPATPEAVYWAVEQARRGGSYGHLDEGGTGVEPDQPDPQAPPVRPRSERMQHVPVSG
jgi:xanthine dehydrogenase large subunit